MEIQPIAYFHSPMKSKFGIPRQSGLVSELTGCIVFEPAYRRMEAICAYRPYCGRPEARSADLRERSGSDGRNPDL